MRVVDLYEEYGSFTKSLTSSGRTLAFGAAAIGWFFRTSDFVFPTMILVSFLFVVLYLTLDMAQYLVSAIMLKRLANRLEADIRKRGGDIETEKVAKPKGFTHIPYILFLSKFPCLMLAYISLGTEFIIRILNH
jgi:hypothetical protein